MSKKPSKPVEKLRVAVIGAGPVGLSLALQAARRLPHWDVSLFDARPVDKSVSDDPRTLALSLGSVQMLERLGTWDPSRAQTIQEVHVTQQPPSVPGGWERLFGEPCLRIRAKDEGVAFLGAVMSYGSIVAPLQKAWSDAVARDPSRLHSRFGQAVTDLKNVGQAVELDASIVEDYDLAVVAEGGVFSDQARKAISHDYQQIAWVGVVEFADRAPGRNPGVAYERFTRHGPAALLPLPDGRAGLVWCVSKHDDPVATLDAAQRITVLNQLFDPVVPAIASVSALKQFPLGLNAERTLTDGRIVRIGNAAQTLHPVAGQGLNLGLRDAFELVSRLSGPHGVEAGLRGLEWSRAADRWTMIAATDFLARSFTWKLPGAGAARGLGLGALQALTPLKSVLAQQMMFGWR